MTYMWVTTEKIPNEITKWAIKLLCCNSLSLRNLGLHRMWFLWRPKSGWSSSPSCCFVRQSFSLQYQPSRRHFELPHGDLSLSSHPGVWELSSYCQRGLVLVLSRCSHVWLFVTPWTVAHQAFLPMDSPGKNTCCHLLLQVTFPIQVSNPCFLCLLRCFTTAPPGKPMGED